MILVVPVAVPVAVILAVPVAVIVVVPVPVAGALALGAALVRGALVGRPLVRRALGAALVRGALVCGALLWVPHDRPFRP